MNVKIILIASLFLFGFIGCSSSELVVSNSAKNISVDGNHEDWNGKLKYFEDEKVAIGFQNDEENLYFCLVTSDRPTAMKIMALGLTVWFDPENGEQEVGLQYPKRMDSVSPRSLMGMNRNKNGKSDFEVTINTMMKNQSEFSLIDDDDVIIYSSSVGSSDGYEMKVGAVNQQFVYEAKVPIGNNSLAQVPINIFPNEKIEIEFETGEIDMDEMRKSGGMQPGMGGGGMGGGMSGGGMRSGGRGGAQPQGIERLSLDVEVKLAK